MKMDAFELTGYSFELPTYSTANISRELSSFVKENERNFVPQTTNAKAFKTQPSTPQKFSSKYTKKNFPSRKQLKETKNSTSKGTKFRKNAPDTAGLSILLSVLESTRQESPDCPLLEKLSENLNIKTFVPCPQLHKDWKKNTSTEPSKYSTTTTKFSKFTRKKVEIDDYNPINHRVQRRKYHIPISQAKYWGYQREDPYQRIPNRRGSSVDITKEFQYPIVRMNSDVILTLALSVVMGLYLFIAITLTLNNNNG